MKLKPARTRPAPAPKPATQPAVPVPAPPARTGPAVGAAYRLRAAMGATDALAPATKYGEFPPPDRLRELDAVELADAIEQHAEAAHQFGAALAAIGQAEPPGGASYKAAVDRDRQARSVDESEVAQLLTARPQRIAAAVLAGHACNRAFDRVLQLAADATDARDRAETALDRWVLDAIERLNHGADHGDAVALTTVEQQQSEQYPALRSTWAWLNAAGARPYRQTRGGIDQRLADAVVARSADITRVLGNPKSGMFSQYASWQISQSGSPATPR